MSMLFFKMAKSSLAAVQFILFQNGSTDQSLIQVLRYHYCHQYLSEDH